jgi:serine/threonine protein kinase
LSGNYRNMGSNLTQVERGEPGDFHLQPGKHLGHYVLENRLGSGGFAEVWQASDPDANRSVAIKIFFDRVTHDPFMWRTIREEPKKQPEHERIVPIYYCHLDSDNTPGPYYVVMKLMQGGTLDERLEKQGRMPPEEAVTIIRQVLDGLDYAHSRGIIHRDLKPTNILFDSKGRPYLADFGIAKDLNKSSGSTTVFGQVGTPAYMSPEQAEGLPLTKASDIYSIGTILYEMLAGKLPFDGPTDTAIMIAKSKYDAPPLRPEIPGIPERLEKVVLTCLERNLEHRYADCGVLLKALDWAAKPVEVPDDPKKKPMKLIAAGVAAAMLLGLGGLALVKFLQNQTSGQAATKEPVRPPPAVKHPSIAPPLSNAPWLYNDPRFTDPTCADSPDCLEHKREALVLLKTRWKTLSYNGDVFRDCMGFQPCLERKSHAEKLAAVRDWSSVSPENRSMLNDCMGFGPCENLSAKRRTAPARDPDDKDAPLDRIKPNGKSLYQQQNLLMVPVRRAMASIFLKRANFNA